MEYVLDQIDKATLEISPSDDGEVYDDISALADELPSHSPRFVLLSYPLTLVRLLVALSNHSRLVTFM